MLKSLKIFLILAAGLGFLLSQKSYSQDTWWKNKKYKTEAKRQKFAECKKVFIEVGDGFNYGNVYYITPHFGSEVYLNFQDNEKGYFSPDQAHFIVDNFLTNYKAKSFNWQISNASDTYAFALGKYKYRKDGYSKTFVVSASLKYTENKWLLEQIIVN